MARKKKFRYRHPEDLADAVWDTEAALILEWSPIATPTLVAKRRRVIERTGQTPYPLHLMPHGIDIILEASEDQKPDKWFPVGGDGPRPLAWLPSRAHSEWYWLRGRDPQLVRPKIPEPVKAAVIERDWPYCQICGGLIALGEQHLDHIIPWSKGGPDTVENLRLSHDLCNIKRGDRVA